MYTSTPPCLPDPPFRFFEGLDPRLLRNGQQSGSAVNSFFDQGKFEAIKLLEAVCCDEHPFCAKIKVSA